MPKKKQEQRFEYRVADKLKAAGFTVINIPMPKFGGHLIDLVATKNGIAYPIEVTGKEAKRDEKRKEKQLTKQKAEFFRSNTSFFRLTQEDGGKVSGEVFLAPFASQILMKVMLKHLKDAGFENWPDEQKSLQELVTKAY